MLYIYILYIYLFGLNNVISTFNHSLNISCTFLIIFAFAFLKHANLSANESLLVSEDVTFGLFILPPQCEVELLMNPSALCCQMAIYPPSSLPLIALALTMLHLPNPGF